MTDKIVYVLSGFAPDKLRFFNQRNDRKIKAVLMNSKDDKSNVANLNWLCDNNILEKNKYAKILIINEAQLEYIYSNQKLYTWYINNINQFISNQFLMKDIDHIKNPAYLSNKLSIYNTLKDSKLGNYSVVDHAKVMSGLEYNKLSKDVKSNFIVKSIYGSGSEGALLGPDMVDESKDYLVEQLIKSTNTKKFYVCTTLVTNKEVSLLITSEDHSEFVDTGYPHTHADFSNYDKLKKFMEYIVNIFGVTNGLFETELVYDEINDRYYLIDLNPRWSTDHCCVNEKFGEIVGKKFDMLDYVYNNKPFYKKVEKFLRKHPKYVGSMKYYASIFVDMKVANMDLKKGIINV